ncbi:MAG: MGMT family protein [Gemmatimonadales bacterium]|nr:MGMT family protein [Gemmatimonadales bacterium]
MRVWKQLRKIPYGKLRTYGQIAKTLRKPQATRAVGQAAGRNPLPILIPCHRVVGKGGSLVGFAGGITTKARLLRLEGHMLGDKAKIEEPRLF